MNSMGESTSRDDNVAASTDGKRLFSVSLSMTVEADSMEEADELLAEALDAPWFGGGGWTTTEIDPDV